MADVHKAHFCTGSYEHKYGAQRLQSVRCGRFRVETMVHTSKSKMIRSRFCSSVLDRWLNKNQSNFSLWRIFCGNVTISMKKVFLCMSVHLDAPKVWGPTLLK